VFGKVTSGLEIVRAIESTPTGAQDRPKTPVKMIKVTVAG
jgi:cyclophilin family peptidyl-prolyl cis-trans isomerase